MPRTRKPTTTLGAKAHFPGFIEPALATLIEKPVSGDRWVHEIKFDGYRVQVHIANAKVKVFTRRGHDWTHRFKKIAADAWHINVGSAIIDGEVVVPSVDGTTDFSVLQNELKGRSKKIVLVSFDLLYLNGRDLRKLPLLARKDEQLLCMAAEKKSLLPRIAVALNRSPGAVKARLVRLKVLRAAAKKNVERCFHCVGIFVNPVRDGGRRPQSM